MSDRKFKVQQNKGLRMALNARYRTRIITLLKKVNVLMMNEFVAKLSEHFYKRQQVVFKD
jgi:hypothetical protein